MNSDHFVTVRLLWGLDEFIEASSRDLLADFRDLPTFEEKLHRRRLVAALETVSRVRILERCESLPVEVRTQDVCKMIERQQQLVADYYHAKEEREGGGWCREGFPDTLLSIGWPDSPEEWGPPPRELIEESARPYVNRFEDFEVVAPVPDLWAEGLTPADLPTEYREAMRKEGYLPAFNEDCDVRSEWVEFFLEGGTGATDPAKWQRVFGMVPRWNP